MCSKTTKVATDTSNTANPTLSATVWFMHRRLNLIAHSNIYTFHYFSCSVEASQSLPFSYPVFHSISFFPIFFRCIFRLLCCSCFVLFSSFLHIFFSHVCVMLKIFSSFSVVVHPFWIWCVYALNWYRYMKTTHIVAKWLFIFWLFHLVVLPSSSLLILMLMLP